MSETMMDNTPADPFGFQYLGSLIGAFGALLYFWPKTIRDALIRATFSIMAGSTLYFVPMDFFNWGMSRDRIIGGAVIVAFMSWPIAGALVRAAKSRLKPD